MPAPVYTQQNIIDALDGMLHGKSAQLTTRQETLNRAARFVMGDIDFRSTKRSGALTPNMFDELYDYTLPSDLKETAIIDIRRQVKRESYERFYLVDETEFDRMKGIAPYRVAVRQFDNNAFLRLDGVRGTRKATIHNCDSLTANGTWAVVSGTDATNLTRDTLNFITGSAALNFDTNSGAATAAIENSNMTQVDLDVYDEKGSIFCWVYVPATSGLTNFILRWGNDASNYWSRTVTTNNEGIAFYVGWNLLRFNWDGATETGTVDPKKIDYLRLTITKTVGMAADTDWRADDFRTRLGEIYDVIYYTKYIWQSSANAYKENSTATGDLIVADTEELELILFKASEFGSQELRDYEDTTYFAGQYEKTKKRYTSNYPSERMKMIRWSRSLRNPNFSHH